MSRMILDPTQKVPNVAYAGRAFELSWKDVDGNPSNLQTSALDVVDVADLNVDRLCAQVVGESGACSAQVWTLQHSLDGKIWAMVGIDVTSTPTITGAGQIVGATVSGLSRVRLALTSAEGSASKVSVSMMVRRSG